MVFIKYLKYALPCAAMLAGLAARAATVEEMTRDVMLSSPAIDALMIGAEARSAASAVEGNLPDPEIEGEMMWPSVAGTERKWSAGIGWSLDWPGVYGARRRAARSEGEAARAEARAEAAGMIDRVRTLLVEGAYNARVLGVQREMLADSDSLLAMTQRARAGGEATLLDEQRLAIENARNRAAVAVTEKALRDIAAQINALHGTSLTAESLGELEYDLTPLPDRDMILAALRESPEARAALLRTEAAADAVGVASAERLPGLGLGYAHSYEEGVHFNGLSASVTIPLFSARGKLKAARAMEYSAMCDAMVKVRAMETETLALYDETERLALQMAELGPVFETTSHSALLRRALEGGEWSMTRYLTERTWFAEARLDYLAIQRDYWLARAAMVRYLVP